MCSDLAWLIASQLKHVFWRLSLKICPCRKSAQNWFQGTLHAGCVTRHHRASSGLLCRIITDDKTWIFEYSPCAKRKSNQLKSMMSPRPKKIRQCQKSKTCWSQSLILGTSFLASSCHKTRLSISNSTKSSCESARRDESNGRTNLGCFAMTGHQLTMSWASSNFWPREKAP